LSLIWKSCSEDELTLEGMENFKEEMALLKRIIKHVKVTLEGCGEEYKEIWLVVNNYKVGLKKSFKEFPWFYK